MVRYRHTLSRSARTWSSGLLRRGLPAVAVLVLFVLAGAAAAARTPPVYRSTTVVLVTPTGLPDDAVVRALHRTESALSLETEAEIVLSAEVVQAASQAAGDSRSVAAVRSSLLVDIPDNTSVLRITAERPEPVRAQRLSQAFADAYLADRRSAAQTALEADVTGLTREVSTLTEQLAKVSRQIPESSSTDQTYALARQRVLVEQLGNARNSVDRLSSTHVSGGSVLSAASRPAGPSLSPHDLARPAGIVLGLFGAALVFRLRRGDRRVRRVRRVGDVERLTGSPVIGYPGPTPSVATGEQVDMLRRDVSAALPTAGSGVLLAIGAGPACAELLADLAEALAASGRSVFLVCTEFGDSATESAIGLEPGCPGLAEALQRQFEPSPVDVPSMPGVRFVPPGRATADSRGLLRGGRMTELIARLRTEADVVVIQAPFAEAASVARLGDVAVLFAELASSRPEELGQVARQLRESGAELAGAVCLSPSGPAASRREPRPAPATAART